MTDSREGPIRVVVADDHARIREGVRALLGSLSDVELVGEAATGREAVALVAAERPDVVLMDLHMPDGDGIAATRAIAGSGSATAVLVVSMLDDDASVFAALRAGAQGYVLKGAAPDELRRAIIGVAAGEAIFGPGIAQRVLALFSAGMRPEPAKVFPDLTDREREVLDHVARGSTNPVIARSLSLSPRTVANHVSNILSKLHATDRTDVAIRARNAGLGSP
ncbi:response regulator transcription factor [soil metagenome]